MFLLFLYFEILEMRLFSLYDLICSPESRSADPLFPLRLSVSLFDIDPCPEARLQVNKTQCLATLLIGARVISIMSFERMCKAKEEAFLKICKIKRT